MAQVLPLIQGIQQSLIITESKRLEDSVRAGANSYLTAMLQIGQGFKALEYISKASETMGLSSLSKIGRFITCLAPFSLSILKNSAYVPKKIRPILLLFHNHLSSLYQIACIVSSVSLLLFGQTFFAISSLIILGIGVMDRNGWLPTKGRQFIHRYTQPLLAATGLVCGGILDRILIVLSTLSWFANIYFSRKQSLRVDFTFQENLTPQMVMDFLGGRLKVKMHPKFIHYRPFPPVPNIDIQLLIEKFDQINWNQHISTLRQKLRHDPRFIERHRDPELKTDQEIIDLTKHTLQTFINTIKERRILEGEPADYEKLHNYLKMIAKHLESQIDETTRIDIIFRLAVEGGEYCGPGKFEVAESVYAQTIGENPDIPFKDKIIYCLQDERNIWMQKFYSAVNTGNVISSRIAQMIDWQDVHTYNVFINLYGSEFGLRQAAADNDDTALIDPLMRWIFFLYFKRNTSRNILEGS